MTKEALTLALEALEVANSCVDGYYIPKGKTHLPEIELAITAIKEALAQAEFDRVHEFLEKDAGIHVSQQAHPEQEPVGWLDSNDKLAEFMHKDLKAEHDKRDSSTPRYFQIPVYTTPPQRTWVGLTDEEIKALANWWPSYDQMPALMVLAKDIQNSLKEKNT